MSWNSCRDFRRAPSLNLDVLNVIYAHLLKHRDTSSMMQTCRSLYRLGIPHLLASSQLPIVISDTRTITSFCSFMLAKLFSSEKIRAFRGLDIDPSFSDNVDHLHVASNLVRVFNISSYLEKLIVRDVTKFFGLWPEIQKDAVNSLRSLRLLYLFHVDDKSVQLLKGMTSPLQELHVSGPEDHLDTTHLPWLSNMAATLTTLTSVDGIYYSQDDIVYPQMKKLHIDHSHLLSITRLIRSFPNLTDLTVNECNISFDDLALQALRLGYRIRKNALKNRWTSLDGLKGDLEFVYSLGLSCPVRELNILSVVDDLDLPILLELLDDFHPRAINVVFGCQNLTAASFGSTLLQPFIKRLSSTCYFASLTLLTKDSLTKISKLMVYSLLRFPSTPILIAHFRNELFHPWNAWVSIFLRFVWYIFHRESGRSP